MPKLCVSGRKLAALSLTSCAPAGAAMTAAIAARMTILRMPLPLGKPSADYRARANPEQHSLLHDPCQTGLAAEDFARRHRIVAVGPGEGREAQEPLAHRRAHRRGHRRGRRLGAIEHDLV